MQRKFLKCCECGNIIISSNNNLSCCDKKMFELVPNKTDAATEKHIPKLGSESVVMTFLRTVVMGGATGN